MQARLYELSNTKTACKVRRAVDYDFQAGAEDHIRKSGIIKKGIRDMMLGGISEKDLVVRLDEEFKELGYLSEKQRRIQSADAYKQIMRYVLSERRKFYPAKSMDVYLPAYDLTIKEVKPDALFWGKDVDGTTTLEVARFKCKKPDVSQKQATSSLELYALARYGRLIVNSGDKVIIKASLYFLRKQNDSNSEEKACFDTDFFNTTGGRNIVYLTEYFEKSASDPYGVDTSFTGLDMRFKPIIESFVNGVPEEECSKEDCEICEFKPICKFSNPPLSIDTPKAARVASGVSLTPSQRAAKEYEKGIVRINAGAGSGKTLVVALRVVSLLNKGVKPEEIFLTTFTNAGAQEMRERIKMLAEDDGIAEDVNVSKIRIMTFNAFGDEIVKEEYKRFGFEEAPHLIDDVERFKIVSEMLAEHEIEGLDYRNFTMDGPRVKGAVIIGARAFEIFKKNPSLGIKDMDKLYDKMDTLTTFCKREAFEELYKLYRDYDKRLRDNCLMEFADQENLIFELLSMEPYYFEKYGFKHIIVDEFQDSSNEQIEIIKRLTNCPSFESLMVVGDDSQSIYSFRDTTPYFIIHFDEVMGCKIDDIQLVENHRSTPEIIEFANKINRMNVSRIDKDLIATRPHGEKVHVQGFLTRAEEMDFVVKKVSERIKSGVKPEDIAILARNKGELNKIADLLAKEGIASVVQFPEKLIEDSRVQAAISMLRAIQEPGDKTDLLIYANALIGGTLKEASAKEIEDACEKADEKLAAFRGIAEEEKRKEAIQELLKELDPDETDSLYQSFVESLLLRTSEKIFTYSEDFALFGQNQELRRVGNYPGVVLTTAHSSKGLEWPVCFNMIGGYDKKELHGNKTTRRMERVEEERRLLFVSSTRARDVLYITAQYTSGGKAGDYIYNQFLIDSYHAMDKEFNIAAIEQERRDKKLREKLEKEEAKKKEKESEEKSKDSEKKTA